MAKRGFHQTSEAFAREINANPNPVAIKTPEGFLLEWWGIFYEAFSSTFPEDALLAAESFDKVALTVENIVSNISTVNPVTPRNHTGVNISNVMVSSSMMPSPHLMAFPPVMASNGPDLLDPNISDLLSSIGTSFVEPNLSPPRDMISILQFLDMSELESMLPSASNTGYSPLQKIPAVPPQWKASDNIRGMNVARPLQMQPNLHATSNALPPWPESSDAAKKRGLQQVSHQGWPSDGIDSVPTVIGHQIVHPTVILPAQKEQEQMNQLRLQSRNKSARKRKASLSSLTAIKKEKATIDNIMNGNSNSQITKGYADLINANKSLYALRKNLAALVQGEQNGISFKEIGRLHATKSELLSCHFHSHGMLLAATGHERKVVIWDLEKNDVKSGVGHAHHITDIRFRPNSTVFATSSYDKTVMIWDATKPSNPFQNLVGHAEHVMSTDFHPTKKDLLTSCDGNDQIRLWDVNRGVCKLILKGGSRNVRFQPRLGNLLASSTGNM